MFLLEKYNSSSTLLGTVNLTGEQNNLISIGAQKEQNIEQYHIN